MSKEKAPAGAIKHIKAIASSRNGGNFYKLGRYEEALASFNEALKLDGNNPVSLNNKGNALRKLGRNEEALVSFTDALKLDGKYEAALDSRNEIIRALSADYGQQRASSSVAEAVVELPVAFAPWPYAAAYPVLADRPPAYAPQGAAANPNAKPLFRAGPDFIGAPSAPPLSPRSSANWQERTSQPAISKDRGK